MIKNVRTEIFPQMIDYDRMTTGQKIPYSMLTGPIQYTSERINTDEYGFRLTTFNNSKYSVKDISRLESVSFLIGGSTVLGVGASNDSQTIPSLLSEKTGHVWINLGIRGSVSFQEYINFINIFHKAQRIQNIVFLSGVNDVYSHFLNPEHSLYDHPINKLNLEFLSRSLKRQIFCHFFAKIKACEPEELMDLTLSEMLFKKIESTKKNVLNSDEKIFEIVSRNFLLYKSLQSIVSDKVGFVLQPFFDWTQKKPSHEESQVMAYLEEFQALTAWPEVRKKMSNQDFYKKLVENYTEQSIFHKIDFFDSNSIYNRSDTLFVDSVHLNDLGNQVATDFIIEKFKLKE